MADLKKMAEELIEKIRSNPKMLASFKDDPVKTLKDMLGIDLPEAQVRQVADLIKTKLAADDIAGMAGKLKGMFGKK